MYEQSPSAAYRSPTTAIRPKAHKKHVLILASDDKALIDKIQINGGPWSLHKTVNIVVLLRTNETHAPIRRNLSVFACVNESECVRWWQHPNISDSSGSNSLAVALFSTKLFIIAYAMNKMNHLRKKENKNNWVRHSTWKYKTIFARSHRSHSSSS